MRLKRIILYAFISLPVFTYAQWPLQTISTDSYVYSVPDHYLLSKVKYTSQHQIGALFNWIDDPPYDNITIDGDPVNYKHNRNSGIFLLRKPSGSNSSGNSGDGQLRIWGSYADYGVDFETDVNDNFIVLGNNVGNDWDTIHPAYGNITDSTQILLFKANLQNKIVWYKLYGGSNAEYAVSIKKAGDGNFIILAQTQSDDGDIKNNIGGKDIWLFKIDGNGNMLWQKTFGSDKDEIPTDLEVLDDGSVVISGSADQSSFAPSLYSGRNSFLLKLTAAGSMMWIKVFGGNGDDKIKSFIPVSDGFTSIGTSTSSDGDYPVNVGKNDIYIFKHDTNGSIIWKKHYGNKDDDEAGDIVYTPCNNKIFASYAKQFSKDREQMSRHPYPLFSQTAGIQIGLLNKDGSQFFYYEDNFNCPDYADNYYFNDQIYNTMAPNDRGGFLAGGFSHWRAGNSYGGKLSYLVRRTFHVYEYGAPLIKNNYDTSLCAGQAAWEIVFSKDTTFSDTLRNSCNVDTLIKNYAVKINTTADSIISKDTTICYAQPFEGISVTGSFTKSDTLNVATDCGFKRIITIKKVFVPPLINTFLGNDTTACNGALLLNAAFQGSSYLWQNGSTTSSLLAQKAGVYWVQVTDSHGCTKSDSITIRFTDLYLSMIHDTTITPEKSVLLMPLTNGTVTWEYSNALSCQTCQNAIATPALTTTFRVTSEKDGCRLNDSVNVTVLKEDYFYIPSAFTPNNDGTNDVFKPTINSISEYSMQVFNRWGQLIFQTNNTLEGWNGRFHNTAQPNGVYVYIINYKNDQGKKHVLKGSFLLIR